MVFQLYLEMQNDGSYLIIVNTGRGEEARVLKSAKEARETADRLLKSWFAGGEN